jgi:hypothetical protein
MLGWKHNCALLFGNEDSQWIVSERVVGEECKEDKTIQWLLMGRYSFGYLKYVRIRSELVLNRFSLPSNALNHHFSTSRPSHS